MSLFVTFHYILTAFAAFVFLEHNPWYENHCINKGMIIFINIIIINYRSVKPASSPINRGDGKIFSENNISASQIDSRVNHLSPDEEG